MLSVRKSNEETEWPSLDDTDHVQYAIVHVAPLIPLDNSCMLNSFLTFSPIATTDATTYPLQMKKKRYMYVSCVDNVLSLCHCEPFLDAFLFLPTAPSTSLIFVDSFSGYLSYASWALILWINSGCTSKDFGMCCYASWVLILWI
jgi:hypothetical protein